MVARLRTRVCRWPRFDRYEIREGRIVPTAGAKIHWYDPWGDYLRSKGDTGGQPPYISLAALHDKLDEDGETNWEPGKGKPPTFSEQGLNAILKWTDQHGLLGVFHQTTIRTDDPGDELPLPPMWTRALGRWQESPMGTITKPQDRICLTTTVAGQFDLQVINARTWLSHFLGPDLPARLPAPDSEEFFMRYGEPVWDWTDAMLTMVGAIVERNEYGDELLNVLAGAATRARRFERAHVQSHIVFPSLLSAWAEMAWQDFEGGNRIGTCGYCGGRFTTDREWTKFCSRDCATKERQRRFLEKNPDYYRVQSRKRRKGK